MAGSYPDAPGYRFAYDVDGTVVVNYGVTAITFSSAQLRSMNNDYPNHLVDLSSEGDLQFCFLFPEPRDISGVTMNRQSANNCILEWSSNTTNGLDGTWTTALSPYAGISTTSKETLRQSITSLSLTNCTALRLNGYGTNATPRRIRNFHIYGSITAPESPDRLRVVDLSDNDIAAQLDFGNVKQRASVTRQFKVTNNSSTQTANSITVSLDVPADATPSLLGQYEVSTDNIAFANAVNIGSLAPGAETGTMYVRMNPTNDAQLGPWSARLIAHPTSWSEV